MDKTEIRKRRCRGVKKKDFQELLQKNIVKEEREEKGEGRKNKKSKKEEVLTRWTEKKLGWNPHLHTQSHQIFHNNSLIFSIKFLAFKWVVQYLQKEKNPTLLRTPRFQDTLFDLTTSKKNHESYLTKTPKIKQEQ